MTGLAFHPAAIQEALADSRIGCATPLGSRYRRGRHPEFGVAARAGGCRVQKRDRVIIAEIDPDILAVGRGQFVCASHAAVRINSNRTVMAAQAKFGRA